MLSKVFFLLLGVRLQLHHLVNLLPDLAVQVLQLVCLIRKFVHVVEERVVLLFCLDERSHDLVDCRDTSGFFDLLESIFDDFDIPQVLIHESLLLSVGGDNLGKTKFQDGQRVLELPVLCFFFRRRRRLVIFNLIFFLLFVELLLVAFDFCFEVVSVFLVFCPECDCLIDLLFGETLAEEGPVVLLLCLAVHLRSQVLQSFGLTILVHNLAAEHVDLPLRLLVLGHCLIQA